MSSFPDVIKKFKINVILVEKCDINQLVHLAVIEITGVVADDSTCFSKIQRCDVLVGFSKLLQTLQKVLSKTLPQIWVKIRTSTSDVCPAYPRVLSEPIQDPQRVLHMPPYT